MAKVTSTVRIESYLWEVHFTVPAAMRDAVPIRFNGMIHPLRIPKQCPIAQVGKTFVYDGCRWIVTGWDCEAKLPDSKKTIALPRLFVEAF